MNNKGFLLFSFLLFTNFAFTMIKKKDKDKNEIELELLKFKDDDSSVFDEKFYELLKQEKPKEVYDFLNKRAQDISPKMLDNWYKSLRNKVDPVLSSVKRNKLIIGVSVFGGLYLTSKLAKYFSQRWMDDYCQYEYTDSSGYHSGSYSIVSFPTSYEAIDRTVNSLGLILLGSVGWAINRYGHQPLLNRLNILYELAVHKKSQKEK